jgi:methionyl-tRNA synthetase
VNEPEETIGYDTFSKVDIRVGRIDSVSEVPKSKKLLKLQVDFGSQVGTRQILAGIAESFPLHAELIGLHTVFVINLEPRRMMGHDSHGMILAAEGTDRAVELTLFPPSVVPGSRVG